MSDEPMRRATWILIGLVVAANGVAQAYSLPVTDYIVHRSTSVTTDLILRFGYFAFMLIVAFLEALLFDELVYRGSWRRRFLGGQRSEARLARHLADAAEVERAGGEAEAGLAGAEAAAPEDDLDMELAEGAPRAWRRWVAENSAPFFLAFLALLAANYFLFNALNGGFDRYYGKTGHLFTQLRSPDAGERCQAILGLAPLRGDTIEERILTRLDRGTAQEQRWAAWALGLRRKLKLPVTRVSLLDRSEQLLAARVRAEGSDGVARAATVALARTLIRRGPDASPADLSALAGRVEREQRTGRVTVETVIAVGLVRSRRAMDLLGQLLVGADEQVALAAAWALGKMQQSSAVRRLLVGLPKASPPVRCAIVRSLGRLGQAARVSQALMLEFARKRADVLCPKRAFSLRPDHAGRQVPDVIHFIGAQTRYRLLLLHTLDRIGGLGDALPWLRRVSAADSPYSRSVRRSARAKLRKWER